MLAYFVLDYDLQVLLYLQFIRNCLSCLVHLYRSDIAWTLSVSEIYNLDSIVDNTIVLPSLTEGCSQWISGPSSMFTDIVYGFGKINI